MAKFHYDDVVQGEILTCPPFSFTEEEIIHFCKRYDSQFFHVDPDKAKHSRFGGLIASGWQTIAMAMQTITRTHFHFPDGVVGLGLDQVRWKTPVRPGDILYTSVTIRDKRLSTSSPGWGIAMLDITVNNQENKRAAEMQTSILIKIPDTP